MAPLLDSFLSLLLLSFAVFLLLSGGFTTYFGAGRSRKIGVALVMVGALGALAFAGLVTTILGSPRPFFDPSRVVEGVAAVVGAAVGAIAALAIFLVAIMKA